MGPHALECVRVRDGGGGAEHDALDHSGEVTQVEQVV